VEAVDLVLVEERAPDVPGHAAPGRLRAAEAIEDLEGSLGVADAARAERHGVVVIEQDDRGARLGEVDRGRKADRPGADHDDRRRRGCRAIELGGPAIGVLRIVVGCQHRQRSSSYACMLASRSAWSNSSAIVESIGLNAGAARSAGCYFVRSKDAIQPSMRRPSRFTTLDWPSRVSTMRPSFSWVYVPATVWPPVLAKTRSSSTNSSFRWPLSD